MKEKTMGVTVTMGCASEAEERARRIALEKEIEKWRKKRSNRAQAVFYTGIVFMFSVYIGVLEDHSLFVVFMVIGICALPFLICVFLLRYANAKVKKLEDEY